MPKDPDIGVGVCVVVWNDKHEILMGKRKGSHASGTWCFPGGWKEKKEKITETACRELWEEAGLLLRNGRELGYTNEFHEDQGIESVTIYLSAISWTGTPTTKEPDKLEGNWTWVSPNDLPSPLFPGIDQIVLRIQQEYQDRMENKHVHDWSWDSVCTICGKGDTQVGMDNLKAQNVHLKNKVTLLQGQIDIMLNRKNKSKPIRWKELKTLGDAFYQATTNLVEFDEAPAAPKGSRDALEEQVDVARANLLAGVLMWGKED